MDIFNVKRARTHLGQTAQPFISQWNDNMTKLFKTGALLLSLSLCMTACGDDISDDAKVSELSEAEAVSLCDEICADATAWSIECESDGGKLTLESDGKAECTSGCAAVKSAKDSCTLTAGDLRKLGKKPANCAEAEVFVGISLQLLVCSM